MAKAASDEEAKAAAHAGWRKSLHDLKSASYHDESSLEPFLVRAEVLQVKDKCRCARVESGVTVSSVRQTCCMMKASQSTSYSTSKPLRRVTLSRASAKMIALSSDSNSIVILVL
jgi:hypothetical protein